jgi:hypothetical protein
MFATGKGCDIKGTIESSGSNGAEQNCAAWLKEDMMALLRRSCGTWKAGN